MAWKLTPTVRWLSFQEGQSTSAPTISRILVWGFDRLICTCEIVLDCHWSISFIFSWSKTHLLLNWFLQFVIRSVMHMSGLWCNISELNLVFKALAMVEHKCKHFLFLCLGPSNSNLKTSISSTAILKSLHYLVHQSKYIYQNNFSLRSFLLSAYFSLLLSQLRSLRIFCLVP